MGEKDVCMLAFASCIGGYHVHKDRSIPVTNEELACRHQPNAMIRMP